MAVIIKFMSSVSVCIFGLVAPEYLDYIYHIYSSNTISIPLVISTLIYTLSL